MGEDRKDREEEFRFSLKAMLRDIEAETAARQQAQGPIDQAEILKLVQSRRKRGADE